MVTLISISLLLVSVVDSARILGIFPTPSISHQIVFQPVWKELSLRGHEVTVVTPNPLNDVTLSNLTEIDISEISYKIWNKNNIGSLGSTTDKKSEGMGDFIRIYLETTNAQLASPELQSLIHDPSLKFDLIIVEYLWPTYVAFKDVFNCPVVGITSLPFTLFQHYNFGNPAHPVTHPDTMLPFSRNLDFSERVKSVLFYMVSRLVSGHVRGILEEQKNTYFSNVTRSLFEICEEISVGIQTVNPILNPPRPTVPAVIDVSGLHIKPAKPLPMDLKNTLDKSMKGFIYFSLGSNVQSSQLPPEKLRMLADTFRELPYDVIWKFESDNLENVPANVHIYKWLPQQDVLRHPNIKLFVTQGGLQSIEEAIYCKVPIIAMPFFADQPNNARKIEELGVGLKLDFLTLTKETLRTSMLSVIENKGYKERITRMSDIVNDQPMSALEKVIWWCEYVIRHHGAHHLKSPTKDIPLYQYFLLDVISFLVISTSLVLYVLTKLTKLLFKTKYVL